MDQLNQYVKENRFLWKFKSKNRLEMILDINLVPI